MHSTLLWCCFVFFVYLFSTVILADTFGVKLICTLFLALSTFRLKKILSERRVARKTNFFTSQSERQWDRSREVDGSNTTANVILNAKSSVSRWDFVIARPYKSRDVILIDLNGSIDSVGKNSNQLGFLMNLRNQGTLFSSREPSPLPPPLPILLVIIFDNHSQKGGEGGSLSLGPFNCGWNSLKCDHSKQSVEQYLLCSVFWVVLSYVICPWSVYCARWFRRLGLDLWRMKSWSIAIQVKATEHFLAGPVYKEVG